MRRIIALAVILAAAAAGWLLWQQRAVRQRTSPPASPAPASLAAAPTPRPIADALAIVGATLIDPSRPEPIEDAAIVTRGARIAEVGTRATSHVPAGAQVIDARGKFVIPGLADMHNHLRSGTSASWQDLPGNLSLLLGWGITTVFTPAMDFDSFAELKRESAADSAPRSHFFSTGPIFNASGGTGNDFAPATPEAARAAVRELKAKNVDAVKLFHDDMSWLLKRKMPLLAPEIVAAIIDESHRQGLKVYAHAPILEYAKETLRAGADGLLHGIISAPVDEELVNLMKRNGAVYIATLSLFESAAGGPEWAAREEAFDERGVIPKRFYAALLTPNAVTLWKERWDNNAYTKAHLPDLRRNLRILFEAGIPIVIGTDTGLRGVVIGVSSHLELLLNVEAGLPPRAVLRAATLNAARMIGREEDAGSVEVGKLADLLILDADPLRDIGNTRRISGIIKGGVPYDPDELLRSVGALQDSPP